MSSFLTVLVHIAAPVVIAAIVQVVARRSQQTQQTVDRAFKDVPRLPRGGKR